MNLHAAKRMAGYTLLELMVAVAIAVVLTVMAVASYKKYIDSAREKDAVGDIGRIQLAIQQYRSRNNGAMPDSLADIGFDAATDPWGNAYVFVDLLGGDTPRTDQNGDPVNNDYDLLSMGPDGVTASVLTSGDAQDDIVRGNGGTYVGSVDHYPRLQ